MKRRSDLPPDDWDAMRDSIVGFGAHSMKKSYYPEIQRQLNDLERFKALLDHSSDAILMVRSASGSLDDVNETACRMLGYERTELLGLLLDEILPADLTSHVRALNPEGQAHPARQEMIISTLRTRAGTVIPVEIAVGALVFQEMPYAVLSARDITERQRMEEEHRRLQEEIIELQAAMLRELSTPMIPFGNGVVVMPLIGAIDSQRAQQMLETLLQGVASQRAQGAIIDITGVPMVDTHVAKALVHAAHAVRLLGTEVVLTGIRPEVAQTMVSMGIELHGVITQSSLESGIAYLLRDNRLSRSAPGLRRY